MALRFYNTLTRSLDVFEPRADGGEALRVYACGPTIYDYAHIGNFRSFVVYDLLHRYLEWSGHDVRFVMNLTDVDDKTIDRAAEAGVTVRAYTDPFGEAFLDDARALGIRAADAYPRATEHVGAMVDFIGRLVDGGHAYVTEDGSVYFSIASFPEYGKLSGVDLDEVRPGARVAVDDYAKDDARDFALWKSAKEKDGRVGAVWESPWGRGRPGWHLECSVMSLSELGGTLDIHLGGEDLVFPHHEDEIAQAEAATGEPFARYWLHVKHLLVEGRKMSKSAGNYIRLRDLLEEGHEPAAVRHQLLGSQYRAELNFTREGLHASARAVQRLVDFEGRLEELRTGDDGQATALPELADRALESVRRAMDDDLNAADALGALFVFVNEANAAIDSAGGLAVVRRSDRDRALDALRSIDEVLGLLEVAGAGRSVDAETEAWIEARIGEREEAREARDFGRADGIRDELAEKGIVLEDTPAGTRWKRVATPVAGE